jgi:putative PIN family toxin of toxin-antitoxin system
VTRKKAVLDTNVVISALLFRGRISRLHELWKERAFSIAASKEIVKDYVGVLAYPKFKLTESEIKDLLQEELLPYSVPVAAADDAGACADPDDNKFLACAEAAKADVIVSGDAHLLSLKKYKGRRIVPAEEFLKKFK